MNVFRCKVLSEGLGDAIQLSSAIHHSADTNGFDKMPTIADLLVLNGTLFKFLRAGLLTADQLRWVSLTRKNFRILILKITGIVRS